MKYTNSMDGRMDLGVEKDVIESFTRRLSHTQTRHGFLQCELEESCLGYRLF